MLSIPCEDRYGVWYDSAETQGPDAAIVSRPHRSGRQKQPTVMLFEDAHWADPTSLEVLDLLIDRVRTSPLLIVLTHRPEFPSRWSRHGYVTA